MQAAKAQASLRICANSLEPSLLADAINTKISYTEQLDINLHFFSRILRDVAHIFLYRLYGAMNNIHYVSSKIQDIFKQ